LNDFLSPVVYGATHFSKILRRAGVRSNCVGREAIDGNVNCDPTTPPTPTVGGFAGEAEFSRDDEATYAVELHRHRRT
jgi:hypothetical protein